MRRWRIYLSKDGYEMIGLSLASVKPVRKTTCIEFDGDSVWPNPNGDLLLESHAVDGGTITPLTGCIAAGQWVAVIPVVG